MIESKTFGKGT